MGIGKALTTLRKKRGLSQGDIARELNVSRQAVSLWESGEGEPLLQKFEEIMDFFDVSANTLLGRPTTAEEADALDAPNDQIAVIQQLDIKACCGSVGEVPSDTPQAHSIRVNMSWLRKHIPFHSPTSVKIIIATGDSMSPLIDDGDMVFVDISQTEFWRDGIYFLIYDNQYFIKRVQRLGGNKVLLISDNPKYRDIEINAESQVQLKIVGRVILDLKPKEMR